MCQCVLQLLPSGKNLISTGFFFAYLMQPNDDKMVLLGGSILLFIVGTVLDFHRVAVFSLFFVRHRPQTVLLLSRVFFPETVRVFHMTGPIQSDSPPAFLKVLGGLGLCLRLANPTFDGFAYHALHFR